MSRHDYITLEDGLIELRVRFRKILNTGDAATLTRSITAYFGWDRYPLKPNSRDIRLMLDEVNALMAQLKHIEETPRCVVCSKKIPRRRLYCDRCRKWLRVQWLAPPRRSRKSVRYLDDSIAAATRVPRCPFDAIGAWKHRLWEESLLECR